MPKGKEKENKEEDLKKEIRDLSDKIRSLEGSLAEVSKPYKEVIAQVDRLLTLSANYFRIIELYQRYGVISPEILVPQIKDPISKEIINILFEKNEQNISEITRKLKERRGKASRRIVREKLQALEEKGIVVRARPSKHKVYKISTDLIKKWSEVLGLVK